MAEHSLEELAEIGRKVLARRETSQRKAKIRNHVKSVLYALWAKGDRTPISDIKI